MAAAMWEKAVPVRLTVTMADRCDASDGRICVHAISHAELLAHGNQEDEWAVTMPYGDSADISLDTATIWPARLHTVIAHELGHAMGLKHTGQGTVMCAMNWCMSDDVTAADAQQWHDVRR